MKVLFETQTGSRAYGLDLEFSDYDVLRIVAHGDDEYLGIKPYKESQQFKNGKSDITVYDIRFFGKLLCAGNPNVILPLYFDRKNYNIIDKSFESLLLHRRDFLGPNIIKCFKGMVQRNVAEFRQWANGEVEDTGAWKKAANSLYILQSLKDLAWYGGLGMRDVQIDFLRSVKKGQEPLELVLASIDSLESSTKAEVLNRFGTTITSSQEDVNDAVNREIVKCLKTHS